MGKKIYVVEDMAISRAALIDMLEDNGHQVVGSAARADKAWLDLKEMDVDIVLLDINLAGEQDGIWLAQKIRDNKNMPIIFLTAYGDNQTLGRIKEVSPNGYLMKPYNTPTLLATVEIAVRAFKDSTQLNIISKDTTSIFIKDRGINEKVMVHEILYIKSDGNYIEIFLREKKYTIREKLTDFLEQLPKSNFLQVHRQYVVNTNKIDTFDYNEALINGEKIPISKTFKNRFMTSVQ